MLKVVIKTVEIGDGRGGKTNYDFFYYDSSYSQKDNNGEPIVKGMIIASQCKGEARFGTDPANQFIRCFTTPEDAVDFLKERIRDLVGRPDLEFTLLHGEPKVQIASAMPQRRM